MRCLLARVAASTAALPVFLVLLGAQPVRAQDEAAIAGRVLTPMGSVATDAEVWLVEIDLRSPVDSEGRFLFEGLPAGAFLVQVTSARWGRSVRRLEARPGVPEEVAISLEPLRELDEIVVSASPRALRGFESAQAVSVVSGSDLSTTAASSLGETLSREPGVSSSYFGPGSSRPLIRGLGGDRVRILEGGIGAGDASDTSPDHAVSVEPRSAERIEIVRGPATLLYGSSAIGGVVNVIDRRIPSRLPYVPITGYAEGLAGTVADEVTGSADITMSAGPFAAHAAGLSRNTDDYAIPGFAERDHATEPAAGGPEPTDDVFGLLENSFIETRRGDVGASVIGDRGYFGLSYGDLGTRYGVPGHGHAEEGGGVSVDLRTRRWDMEGEWRISGERLDGVRMRFGRSDYSHAELEGSEVGTRFLNDSWEGRLELDHRIPGLGGGAVGLQLSSRDFEAIGDEAFVPPTATDRRGAFVFQEFSLDSVGIQIGARLEHLNAESPEQASSRSFTGLSGSIGLNWAAEDRLSLGAAFARSVKFPNAEELYSNGPHLATNSFDLGNPMLKEESALSADGTIRLRQGRLTGALTVFVNRFSDFIFQDYTGEEEAGLPVLQFRQEDATFVGYEIEAELEVFHSDRHHAALQLFSDHVRAELAESGSPLPRIPPLSIGVGALYDGGRLHAHASARRTARQTRVAELEEETSGYTMLDASLRYRLFSGRLTHEVILAGTNLTDQEARSHVSLLKEVAPFPGREIQLIYRFSF